MTTKLERFIPPNYNRSLFYSVLNPEQLECVNCDVDTYIDSIIKYEIECEYKLRELFRMLSIQSSFKQDRYSLPFTHEVVGEIAVTSYVNYAYNIDNIARVFVKDLLDKNVSKIRFYLFVEEVIEDETISKRQFGKVFYKFRYMIHY
jgi:hypothetical protein